MLRCWRCRCWVQEVVVNSSAVELLRRLPGITDHNYRTVLRECESLAALAQCSVQRLEQVLGGSKAAKALHDFLHAPCPRM
jgi:DNA excision repair protein ERCC-4